MPSKSALTSRRSGAALAQYAKDIARLGKDLYDRIVTLGEHWNKVGERLGRTVEAYNKSTDVLESRVMVQARKFRDLKDGQGNSAIDELEQIDRAPRMLQAEEFAAQRGGGAKTPECAGRDSFDHWFIFSAI